MKIKKKHFLNISYVMLSLAFFQLIFSVANGIFEHDLFFNSDALYLAQIYQTFFIDKVNFSTFKFPDAPFFFPDFLIFSFFRFLTGNFILANVITPLLIFGLIMTCFILVFDQMVKSDESILKPIFIAFTSIYILLLANRLLFVSSIMFLSPVWHEGSILSSVFLLLVFLLMLKKETKFMYIVTFLVTTLTVFSDKFVIKDMIFPLFTAFFVLIVLDLKNIKKYYKFFVVLTAGVFSGNFLYKLIMPQTRSYTGPVTWYYDNLNDMGQALKSVFIESSLVMGVAGENRDFANYLIFFIPIIFLSILIAGFVTLKHIYLSLNSKNKKAFNIPLLIFSVATFSQFFYNILATVLYSDFRSLTHLRYLGAIFIFPLFWLVSSALIKYYAQIKKYLLHIFITLVVIFAGLSVRTIFISNKGGFGNFLRYKPPNTECVDKVVSDYGYIHGLGDLWNATTTTLYSKKGAQIHHIITYGGFYLQPHYWLSSSKSYLGNKYNYILTKRLHEEIIIEELGEPDEVINCPTTDVFIYHGDKASEKINQRFQSRLFNQILKENGGSLTIAAQDFSKYISRPYFLKEEEIGHEITSEGYLKPAPNSEGGYFHKGPVVYLENGNYQIELTYSTNQPKTGLYALVSPDKNQVLRVAFENTNGKFQTFTTKLNTDKYLAFFPIYSGQGEILIKEMTITKLD